MALKLLDSKITEDTALQDVSEPRLRGGRLGGLLFCAGAVAVRARHADARCCAARWVFAVIALGFLTGVACLGIAWERIPAHLASPRAGDRHARDHRLRLGNGCGRQRLLVALPDRRRDGRLRVSQPSAGRGPSGARLGCLAAPLADPAIASGDSLRNLVASGPTLILTAVLVTYFRERLEAGTAPTRSCRGSIR